MEQAIYVVDQCPLGRMGLKTLFAPILNQMSAEVNYQEFARVEQLLECPDKNILLIVLVERDSIWQLEPQIQLLHTQWPQARFIVGDYDSLSPPEQRKELISLLLQSELKGYFTQTTPVAKIQDLISHVLDGQVLINPPLDAHQGNEAFYFLLSRLTLREREILELLLNNYDNDAIAETLHLSKRTVETHRSRVMSKLQVKTPFALIHPQFADVLFHFKLLQHFPRQSVHPKAQLVEYPVTSARSFQQRKVGG